MEKYYEDNSKEELEKIKINETGKPLHTAAIILLIFGVIGFVLFLILGISEYDDDGFLSILYIFIGLSCLGSSYIFYTVLNMFYETHYVITHLIDIVEKKEELIHCKVCGKEIPFNENGTCEKCNKEILKRIEEKNK